ncbi:transcriptional regulator [Gammaproteobacteria bacterium 45_16_T64]|nr:transcriptional regulator [Gammaproteobacteria bacterium 45_16_T64]
MRIDKRDVVFGFLGQTMDAVSQRRGKFEKRFERWRPTISLVQHPATLPLQRLVLLHHANEVELRDIIIADIAEVAPQVEVELHQINFDSPWDFNQVFPVLYRFISEYPFDLENENYYFHLTTGSNIQQASVFLSVGARYFPGQLLQSGPDATAAIGSKLDIIDLGNAPKAVSDIFNQQRKQGADFLKRGIPTKNQAFNTMIQQIERVAIRSKAPMLVTGPTGAGKSNLASRIYDLKKQRHEMVGKFVEVNCATIVGENSAMATLFGHTKGAYTGAISARDGLLKKADNGLLFLDEIGDLKLDEQAMLLRALEAKKFYPLGSDVEVSSEFQLICGTNKDLRVEVIEGRFREDLFARINLFTYRLPGLAERREDIEPNLAYELDRYQYDHGSQIRMTPAAKKQYLHFALSKEALWKGNFRDLNASVVRMGTLADAATIDGESVATEIDALKYLWGGGESIDGKPEVVELSQYLSPEMLADMDKIDQLVCASVIETCLRSKSASHAGRELYHVSRLKRSKPNDGARITALLVKYGIRFQDLGG